MKLTYKKPAVNSLVDPKAGFPLSLLTTAPAIVSVVNAATKVKNALGNNYGLVKGNTLVDKKGDCGIF